MEDDDLKVDPVFASHNIMIKHCEKNNIIPMIVLFSTHFKLYCNSIPNILKKYFITFDTFGTFIDLKSIKFKNRC